MNVLHRSFVYFRDILFRVNHACAPNADFITRQDKGILYPAHILAPYILKYRFLGVIYRGVDLGKVQLKPL